MDTVATPTVESPPSPRSRRLGAIVLVVFSLYVAALYVLALDQQFHWGLFPTKVEKQLTAQVAQLGDASLPPEKHQAVVDDIVSWNTFSVPVLLKAIEKGPVEARGPAAQCLQAISLKFYNMDITPLGTDTAKLKDWWIKLNDQWAKAEQEKK